MKQIPASLSLNWDKLIAFVLRPDECYSPTGEYRPVKIDRTWANELTRLPGFGSYAHIETRNENEFYLWRYQDWRQQEPQIIARREQNATEYARFAENRLKFNRAVKIWREKAGRMAEPVAREFVELMLRRAWDRNGNTLCKESADFVNETLAWKIPV